MHENSKYQTELNLKEAIRNPHRLFGLFYALFIVSLVIGGAYYAQNLDSTSDNDPAFKSGTQAEPIGDIQEKTASKQAGVSVDSLKMSTPELIAQGKASFITNCVSCHGDQGFGDGIAGASLNPKPRNFHQADGWTNGRKFSEMYKTLEEGIPETGMNAYNQLPVAERFALIHYIRSFTNDFPPAGDEEMSELDLNYSLASGRQAAAQIPTAKSMKLIIKESGENKASASKALETINGDGSPEAGIFRAVAYDKARAVRSLMSNSSWRAGTGDFAVFLSSTLGNNGFRGEVLKLNAAELGSLHSYLNRILINKNAATLTATNE